MAIINVTGDDLFSKKDAASGELAAPLEDETLSKEIPLLIKQIEATMQEIERAVQLLKHALDLEKVQVVYCYSSLIPSMLSISFLLSLLFIVFLLSLSIFNPILQISVRIPSSLHRLLHCSQSSSKGMTPSSTHRSHGRSSASSKASRQAELREAKAQAAEALERAARFGGQSHPNTSGNPIGSPSAAGVSPTTRARMLRSPKLTTPYASSASATAASFHGHSNGQHHMYATPKPRGSSSASNGGVSSPTTSRGRHLTPSTVTAPTLKVSAPTAASSLRKSVSPTGRRPFNHKANNNTTHRLSSPAARPSISRGSTTNQATSHPHDASSAAAAAGYPAGRSSVRASSSPKSPIVVGIIYI